MNIPILSPILKVIDSGITAVGDGFKTWNDGRVRVKEAKIERDVARYQAQAEHAGRELDAETNYDMVALKSMESGWKDEFLMVLFVAPLILLFIPATHDTAKAGFETLQDVPYGYWLIIFGITASTFGLRWLFSKRVERAIGSMKGEEHKPGDKYPPGFQS